MEWKVATLHEHFKIILILVIASEVSILKFIQRAIKTYLSYSTSYIITNPRGMQ